MLKTNTSSPIVAKTEAIVHKGEQRIKVIIPNEDRAKTLIKQVTGRRWSQSKGCWHVPYTKVAFQELKELFETAEMLI